MVGVDLNVYNGTLDELKARYVISGSNQPVTKPGAQSQSTEVTYVNGSQTCKGTDVLIDNKNYVPIRELEDMFGFIVCFETESKVATINGCKVQDGRLIGCAAQPFTDLSLTLRLWCGALAGLSATELFELVLSNRLSTSK